LHYGVASEGVQVFPEGLSDEMEIFLLNSMFPLSMAMFFINQKAISTSSKLMDFPQPKYRQSDKRLYDRTDG
jgi:hypothetical protein